MNKLIKLTILPLCISSGFASSITNFSLDDYFKLTKEDQPITTTIGDQDYSVEGEVHFQGLSQYISEHQEPGSDVIQVHFYHGKRDNDIQNTCNGRLNLIPIK